MDFIEAESAGVERVELGDVPVVVAIAVGGDEGEAGAVGRPVEFVDVHVGGRDLAEFAGGEVDEGEALFEEGVLDFAGFGSFGDERAGGAGGVFGEEDGDGFAVGGPARGGEETFYVGEFFGGATGGADDVELELAGFCGVGEESELLAVGRPGEAAFGAGNIDGAAVMRLGAAVESRSAR